MNVCGLRSKLLISEFLSYINQFDVVALSETKLDDLDEIVIPDFECVTKNRKQKTARKSGGIAVQVKNDILKHFSVVDSECEYVLWFTLSKAIFLELMLMFFLVLFIYHLKIQDIIQKVLWNSFTLKLMKIQDPLSIL